MKKNLLVLGLLIVLTLICYGQTIDNEFFLDDHFLIVENGELISRMNFERFFEPYPGSAHIRPVGTALIHYFYPRFGTDPSLYRLFNMSVFVLCSFLLFIFIRRITKDFDIALLTAALFCAHPVNTVVINFITTHIFTIFACFALIALLFLDGFKSFNIRGVLCVVVSFLFYVISALCHPISVVLPLVVFGFLFFHKRFSFWRSFKISLPYFIFLGGYLYVRLARTDMGNFMKRSMGESQFDVFAYGAGLYDLFFWFIKKLVMPVDMTFINNVLTVAPPYLGRIIGLMALLAAMIWVVIYFKKDVRSFGVYWFGCGFIMVAASAGVYGFLGLTLEVFWFIFNVMGFFLLVAMLMAQVKQRFESKTFYLLSAFVILLLCNFTRDNNFQWRTEKGYFVHQLKETPGNALINLKLGDIYAREGQTQRALVLYQQLLDLTYGYKPAEALSNMGDIYKDRRDYITAAQYYYQAIVSKDLCEECAFSYIGAYIEMVDQMKGYDIDSAHGILAKERYESNPSQLMYTLNLASFYFANNEVSDQYAANAIDLLQAALQKETNPVIQEYILSSLAAILFKNNELLRAEDYVRRLFDQNQNSSILEFLYNTFIRAGINPEDESVLSFINPIIGDYQ